MEKNKQKWLVGGVIASLVLSFIAVATSFGMAGDLQGKFQMRQPSTKIQSDSMNKMATDNKTSLDVNAVAPSDAGKSFSDVPGDTERPWGWMRECMDGTAPLNWSGNTHTREWCRMTWKSQN